jgi:hypothetical protein
MNETKWDGRTICIRFIEFFILRFFREDTKEEIILKVGTIN